MKNSFSAQSAKKASAKGRSPLQKLEVRPRSRLYLLVIIIMGMQWPLCVILTLDVSSESRWSSFAKCSVFYHFVLWVLAATLAPSPAKVRNNPGVTGSSAGGGRRSCLIGDKYRQQLRAGGRPRHLGDTSRTWPPQGFQWFKIKICVPIGHLKITLKFPKVILDDKF